MIRLSLVLIFGFALTQSQVSGNVLTKDVEEVENFFKHIYESLIEEVHKAVSSIRRAWDNLIHGARMEIEGLVDTAIENVAADDKLPAHCKKALPAKLETVKKAGFAQFFTCSNLTDALVEGGSIVVLSLELTSNLTANLDGLITEIKKCSNASFFNKASCWISAFGNVKTGWANDLQDIGNYEQKVKTLVHDIGANIDYCLHPAKKNTTQAIGKALQEVYNCAYQHH